MQSFESSNTKVIHKQHVAESNSVATIPSQPGTPTSTPKVDAIRQGDTVRNLVIQCSCGQQIDVECVYD